MKPSIKRSETAIRQKSAISSSPIRRLGLALAVLVMGSMLLLSVGAGQTAVAANSKDQKLNDQQRLFQHICAMVREAGKEMTHRHIPEELKGRLILLLERAAALTNDTGQRRYLAMLRRNIRNNIFKSPPLPQYSREGMKPDIIFLPDSVAKKLMVFVIKIQPAETRVAGDSLKAGLKMASDYPLKDKMSGLFFPQDHLIRVGEILCASHDDRMALNIPIHSFQSESHPFVLILLKDRIDRYFTSHIQPLGQRVMDSDWSKKMDAHTYYTILLLHRISHYYGPVEVVPPKTGIPVHERLKELFYVFEEIRADTAFLADLSLWKSHKLSTDKQKVYPTFVISLIDRLLSGLKKKAMLPFLVEFNFLLQKGALFYDLNQGSLSVDVKKFTSVISFLRDKSLQILRRGKYEEAENFIQEFAGVSKELNEVINRFRQASAGSEAVIPDK
jgi:hypothetical protein